MRLIDADELLEKHTCDVYGAYDDSVVLKAVFTPYIKGAPTIDAVPVVHGRWNRTDDPEFIMGDFECSACEYLECDVDTSCLLPGVNCLYYCPNCGARMDLDGG